jgi:hypothetical protein
MPPDATPPVDLNKPVENPSLVSAISHFDASKQITVQPKVVQQLNAANYLIPILSVQIPTTPKGPDGRCDCHARYENQNPSSKRCIRQTVLAPVHRLARFARVE